MAIQKRTATAALALATSANGTVRNGANLSSELFALGSLVCECTSQITTSSVVATFAVQGSVDGTTWYNIALVNNAANVSTAAGTGSAVTTTIALCVPGNASAYPLVRCNATLSGASTGSSDKTQVTYRYVQPGGLEQVR